MLAVFAHFSTNKEVEMERDETVLKSVFLKPASWEIESVLSELIRIGLEVPESPAALEVVHITPLFCIGRLVCWQDGQLAPFGAPFILRLLSEESLLALQFEGMSWAVTTLTDECLDRHPWEYAAAERLRFQMECADKNREQDEAEKIRWRERCEAVVAPKALRTVQILTTVLVVIVVLSAWLFAFAA